MSFIKHSKHSGKILSWIYHKFTLDLCEYGPSSELGLGIAKKKKKIRCSQSPKEVSHSWGGRQMNGQLKCPWVHVVITGKGLCEEVEGVPGGLGGEGRECGEVMKSQGHIFEPS